MQKQITRRLDAAQGRIPCDLVIRNVKFLDVFHCKFRDGDIAVIDGVIVGVEPGLKGAREIDARGAWLVPGFIDAHVHLESSLMTPDHFEKSVLPHGTTTAICDPHELANVLGVPGIEYFLDASEKMKLDLKVMLSSCVPATHLETNGGGTITAKDLLPLKSRKNALGLAEVMNVPGVLHGDPNMLEKITGFMGMPLDGHAPLLRGQALSAYAACCISSCHESSEFEEASEKLTKGISVWIREGSVAKDLDALAKLLSVETSTSLGFCTDDRNPLDIAHEGHVDHLIRRSIGKHGISPEAAYRAASWSVARHYGLDKGFQRKGAIAPGYTADFVLLSDAKACAIQKVFKSGIETSELEYVSTQATAASNSIRTKAPLETDLEGPSGQVHVIGVIPGKIITDHLRLDSAAKGVARISVLERYGHGSKPANGYVYGFGDNFNGAIASSVGHDSHNLCVTGSNTRDMRAALDCLIQSGGGFCVVKDGAVLAHLALPFGGLMTSAAPAEISSKLQSLRDASRSIGCTLAEPFLQLAFLCLPVIPKLKITDKGLVDVEKFSIIPVC